MTKLRTSMFYYALLLLVVIIWGLDPVVYTYFYESFSAGMLSVVSTGAAFVFFVVLSNKKLLNISAECLRVALPISFLKAAANIFQRIGLQYTTPAAYSFRWLWLFLHANFQDRLYGYRLLLVLRDVLYSLDLTDLRDLGSENFFADSRVLLRDLERL